MNECMNECLLSFLPPFLPPSHFCCLVRRKLRGDGNGDGGNAAAVVDGVLAGRRVLYFDALVM